MYVCDGGVKAQMLVCVCVCVCVRAHTCTRVQTFLCGIRFKELVEEFMLERLWSSSQIR